MINKKYLKILRGRDRAENNNFIYETIAKRLIDSIDLLTININSALEIGINENLIFDYVKKKFNKLNVDRSDVQLKKNQKISSFNFFEIDIDNLNFKENKYDLIYSNHFLNLFIDFEKTLNIVFKSLKKNGFFICAIPDTGSMYQLFNTMYKTDLYLYDGVYQRNNPTIEINNIFAILKKLNFESPNIHSDNFTIEYQNFEKLLKDIQSMNMSYCYIDKKNKFESKKYFEVLEKFYRKSFFDENYKLEIKVNLISGWKT